MFPPVCFCVWPYSSSHVLKSHTQHLHTHTHVHAHTPPYIHTHMHAQSTLRQHTGQKGKTGEKRGAEPRALATTQQNRGAEHRALATTQQNRGEVRNKLQHTSKHKHTHTASVLVFSGPLGGRTLNEEVRLRRCWPHLKIWVTPKKGEVECSTKGMHVPLCIDTFAAPHKKR